MLQKGKDVNLRLNLLSIYTLNKNWHLKNEAILMKHFNAIINKLQSLRIQYPKGTVNNMLYKELGNGIYGNIVKGISNKKEFDTLTGQMSRVKASELSIPILASWTIAFIRSVIG